LRPMEIATGMSVPLVDLASTYQEYEDELVAAFRHVLRGGQYILGPEIESFEAHVAQWLGIGHCVAVSSGTDALLAALLALQIGPGDEVITSPLTFVSTAEVILRVGATPVFADICPRCLCLDPSSVATQLSPRTRAIMPVHLYGELGHIEELVTLARDNGAFLIEDACQAFGSETSSERKAGTIGDIGCFSFFPTKILGAIGDAGLLCTDDATWAERLRSLRSHGRTSKHLFSRLGGNFRMDAMHAALLKVLLRRVDGWISTRGIIAKEYTKALSGLPGICTPSACTSGNRAWSVYTVRVRQHRDRLAQYLKTAGIETGIYYPTTLADQPLFEGVVPASVNLEHARTAASDVLSLPIYPGMSCTSQTLVVQRIRDYPIAEKSTHAHGQRII
jgi:dTDP-4-amino-4,6-dideoxygalactose transaminase